MARTRKDNKVMSLFIQDFPIEIADKIEEMARAMRPPMTRNDLIRYLLAEYSEGRVELGMDREAAPAA